jgi:hypothetical protein
MAVFCSDTGAFAANHAPPRTGPYLRLFVGRDVKISGRASTSSITPASCLHGTVVMNDVVLPPDRPHFLINTQGSLLAKGHGLGSVILGAATIACTNVSKRLLSVSGVVVSVSAPSQPSK